MLLILPYILHLIHEHEHFSTFQAQHICDTLDNSLTSKDASAGSRTRVDCLEGNHANRYTTDAVRFTVYVCTTPSLLPHWIAQIKEAKLN